jgi:choline-glycine betaine transporter
MRESMKERIHSAAYTGFIWLTAYFLVVMSTVAIRAVNKEPIHLVQDLRVIVGCGIGIFCLGFMHGLWKQYQHDKKDRVPKRLG